MNKWQKDMINTIMDGTDIATTLAELLTNNYADADIYTDNLADEIASMDIAFAEELKDDLDNEVVNYKEL